ncbi:hypothetical protein C8J56DRAFT_1116728 [Mycena floridula]|nr:hypothetical protein C8J56DRAFT_1116728 [Mycena floridula]
MIKPSSQNSTDFVENPFDLGQNETDLHEFAGRLDILCSLKPQKSNHQPAVMNLHGDNDVLLFVLAEAILFVFIFALTAVILAAMNRDRYGRYIVDPAVGLIDEMQSVIDGTFEIPTEPYQWNPAAMSQPAETMLAPPGSNIGYSGRPARKVHRPQASHYHGQPGSRAPSYHFDSVQNRPTMFQPAQSTVSSNEPPPIATLTNMFGSLLQKTDQILAKMVSTEQEMEQLKKKVNHMESSTNPSSNDIPSNSRNFSARGRIRQQKMSPQRRPARNPSPTGSDGDGDISDHGLQKDSELDGEDMGLPTGLLSGDAKKLKAIFTKDSLSTFRRMTGVPAGERWPEDFTQRINPVTNEVYLTPNFTLTVTKEPNATIVSKVANSVFNDLKQPDYGEPLLMDRRFKWGKGTIVEVVKDTFRNIKKNYKAQVDDVAAEAYERSLQINRRASRRAEKLELLKAGVPRYKSEFNLDPTILLAVDHMSDEASGPEDNDVPGAQEAWQQEMAARIRAVVGGTAFEESPNALEIIHPSWRSAELSETLHKLREFGLEAKKKNKRKYTRVYDTGRYTDTPPLTAPWNFGIDPSWWMIYGPGGLDEAVFKHCIGDWNTYPDPPGFGSNKFTAIQSDEVLTGEEVIRSEENHVEPAQDGQNGGP